MPPLLLLALASVLIVSFASRVWSLSHKRDIGELPFIANITHGICPKCGECNPASAMIAKEPACFWRQFSCRCGFAVKAHLKTD